MGSKKTILLFVTELGVIGCSNWKMIPITDRFLIDSFSYFLFQIQKAGHGNSPDLPLRLDNLNVLQCPDLRNRF
jgi:hypothetical protein